MLGKVISACKDSAFCEKKRKDAKKFCFSTRLCCSWSVFSRLKPHREDDFNGEIASRVENALATCTSVDVGILETAEVTLVGAVEQVVGYEVEFTELAPSTQEDVRTDGGVKEGVGGRCRLGIIGAIIMILT